MTDGAKSHAFWADSLQAAPTEDAFWAIDSLRANIGDGRARAGIDPVETCELLELDRYAATRTYLTALAMSLTEAIGDEPMMNAPGCVRFTFDEAWLLRLFERCQAQDAESMAFLISSRVPHRYRNSIAFLVNGLVARFEGGGADPDRTDMAKG
ncbi:MAG: hypothetical protein AAGC86_15625 [Pseudomonadota bacterium]